MIEWCRDGEVGTCKAIDTNGVRMLTKAVIAGKRHFGGSRGSFQINVFGQVLVPAPDGRGSRVMVGETRGHLVFDNPFDDEGWLDLSDPGELRCGDSWPFPYVGMPYNLSKRSQIYFFNKLLDESEYPPSQDHHLIAAIRTVRRSGAVRFIVNPYGLVLTKRPPTGPWRPEEQWEPVFLGRIDSRAWFRKEES